VRKDKEFLNLFFNAGETFCVSNSKYAYHSITKEDFLSDNFTLVSPSSKVKPFQVTKEDIVLMALNPIKGFKSDQNVTGFRAFLVEVDSGSLIEQTEYVKSMGMPYSCCVFSGNKSLHYAIVIDEDLNSLNEYQFYSRWIHNIMSKADQQTLSPSYAIRYPFNQRKDGRQLVQSLVELKGRVKKQDLVEWLQKHADKRPTVPKREPKSTTPPDPRKLPSWLLDQLAEGIDFSEGRNTTWFKIAIRLAQANYGEDDIVDILDHYFEEESDFPRKEFLTCIKSAYRKVNNGN
jgi:hypothetical protein